MKWQKDFGKFVLPCNLARRQFIIFKDERQKISKEAVHGAIVNALTKVNIYAAVVIVRDNRCSR